MARTNSIEPFPADIDRAHFGHYLAGFTDGEGCFALNLHTYKASFCVRPCAAYTITLRADDLPILRLIQSFFGCGVCTRGRFGHAPRCDTMTFRITDTAALASIVIPHFETHRLHAKKRHDFHIWKEGVLFIREVISLPRAGVGRAGQPYHWTKERLEHFLAIRARLREGREYANHP